MINRESINAQMRKKVNESFEDNSFVAGSQYGDILIA
jgi:hypothetical protein